MKALGMIEVYGYLAAVEALDSALKTADVSLVEVTKVTGGLVSVMLSGDVAAAKAAVNAAAASAARVGRVVSAHVIARPASDIDKIVGTKDRGEKPEEISPAAGMDQTASDREIQLTDETMKKMTVSYLRSLARELGVLSMTKEEIRYAKKSELISTILDHMKGE